MKSFHIGKHKVAVLRVAELPPEQRTPDHWEAWTFTIDGVVENYSASTREIALREARHRANYLFRNP